MGEQRLAWISGFGITSMPGAQDAQGAFRAFDITAKPEEIVGRTAWQASRHVAGEALLCGQKRGAFHRLVADDPDIRRTPARLHGDCGNVVAASNPCEATRHDLPAILGAGGKNAKAHRARHELVADIGRGG
ncbi:hypothetical protein D3C78_1618710 [compost metagenome]